MKKKLQELEKLNSLNTKPVEFAHKAFIVGRDSIYSNLHV